jgi:hypothetical protein
MEISVTLYGIVVVLLLRLALIWTSQPDALRNAILRGHARRIGRRE